MKFELNFKNISILENKYPICRIELNGRDVFVSRVQERITFDAETKDQNVLRIHFVNKEGKDSILGANNQIIKDLSFELEKIVMDGIDLKNMIWESKYITQDQSIDSCLFFGPKGYWELNFDTPVLKWFLQTNHNKNNNDPTWKVDYNYYEEACQKLSKIQTR